MPEAHTSCARNWKDGSVLVAFVEKLGSAASTHMIDSQPFIIPVSGNPAPLSNMGTRHM